VIRGRIVKTAGDGVLLEFPSIVAAVECAVATGRRRGDRMRRREFIALVGGAVTAWSLATHSFAADKRYDQGASDTEIKIGNIVPYSGPASSYDLIGRTEARYFTKINAEGGINGRKIRFISYDDAYIPSRAVEQARRLVEEDGVLLIFQSSGTASNAAIRSYMNEKKIPQLFVASGAAKWNDPKNFPWTMGWQPNYQSEGRIYAKYLLENRAGGKIGILYQNDEYGRDYLKGFKDGLGAKIPIVAEVAYEVSDATVDSQIIELQGSGADIFFDVTIPKFTALAVRKAAEIGWQPFHLLNNVSSSVGSSLRSAGFHNVLGTVSTAYFKQPGDPAWTNDPAYRDWAAFMHNYLPGGRPRTSSETVYGYLAAQTLVEVLKRCGDDLTRNNIMKQAAGLENLELGMLLPGITVNTGPNDYAPLKQMQLQRFGYEWQLFGPVITGEVGAR
jgi:branched-chain amino acid transport system substrate-binding protein